MVWCLCVICCIVFRLLYVGLVSSDDLDVRYINGYVIKNIMMRFRIVVRFRVNVNFFI